MIRYQCKVEECGCYAKYPSIPIILPTCLEHGPMEVVKQEGIKSVIDTFDSLKELHIKKNQDYTGNSLDPFFNFNVATDIHSLFYINRDKTFATIIGIKLGRIAALLNSGKPANNESVLDSFDDAIVYLALWKADLESRGVK